MSIKESFVFTRTVHSPYLILAIVISSILVACTVFTLKLSFFRDFKQPTMFADLNDLYGDLVKSPLAMTDITIECAHGENPAFTHWDDLYKGYFTNNPYLFMGKRFGLDNFLVALPPLTINYARCIARLITLTNPSWTVGIQFSVYILLVALFSGFLNGKLDISLSISILLGLLMIVSMPALFMFNRGNYISSISVILAALYTFTKFKNTYWFIGILSIALAINLRPNLTTFLLLEFFPDKNPILIFKRVLIVFLATASTFAVSYFVAIQDWPEYNFGAFLIGLQTYNFYYVLNDGGLEFGASLLGMIKILRQSFGFQPLFLPEISTSINILGFILVICSCWTAWRGTIDLPQGSFLGACITALFCPVFAYYHCLIFVIPLCLTLEKLKNVESVKTTDVVVIVASTVPLLCIPDWRVLGFVVPFILLSGLIWVLISTAQLSSHRQII